MEVAEGNGPVNALDAALRKAFGPRHPELTRIHLTDFKVRVLDSVAGTAAITRASSLIPPTATAPGPPLACRRTSSRPPGRPCRTRSCSGFYTPAPGSTNLGPWPNPISSRSSRPTRSGR